MADPESTVLLAEGLVKRFPQGDREIEILHGISLALRRGEIIAVSGPSGAGKSTLLHVLGFMEQPSSGILRIRGRETSDLNASESAQLRSEFIGFLFQFHNL